MKSEILIRDFTNEELQFLHSKLPLLKEDNKEFLTIILLISPLPLLTLIVYMFTNTNKSDIGTYIFAAIVIILFLAFYMKKNSNIVMGHDLYQSALNEGKAYEMTVRPIKVHLRKSSEGVPESYYLTINIDEKVKTLFLQGEYINDLKQTGLFPNSEFKIVRTLTGDIVLDQKIFGRKMSISGILDPFNKEDYLKGFTPKDNSLLDYKPN